MIILTLEVGTISLFLCPKETEKMGFYSVKIKINLRALPLIITYVENIWMLGLYRDPRHVMFTASLSEITALISSLVKVGTSCPPTIFSFYL